MIFAGVDEVGRGPLAGPVLACAVILNKRVKITGIRDSKKISESKRLELSALIKAKAISWSIGMASVKEIDHLNILNASLLAMKRAVETLPIKPQKVLVDGMHCPEILYPVESIIGGDDKILEIAAASIVAKVTRDYMMCLFDKKYPQFRFSQHKGYATKYHIHALKKYGPTKLHRRYFSPVKELLVSG